MNKYSKSHRIRGRNRRSSQLRMTIGGVPMFQATILIDNDAEAGFCSEWGFSVYVEYNGRTYLLDTGSSDQYLTNARRMSIPVEEIDYAVLSHGHYDHSGGYDSFFLNNRKAKLYVSEHCGDRCFHKIGFLNKYIGIPKDLLEKHRERIVPVKGFCQLEEGVWLVPHLKNDLEQLGKRASLYREVNKKLVPDDFSHEQSLVFETERGLVVLNSCSHAGLENIMKDLEHYLPGKKVLMTIGGLHLASLTNLDVRKSVESIKELDIEHVITGHCTGSNAMELLRQELGERLIESYAGLTVKVRETEAVS